ncbi:MAG: agmatine deiminase [Bacteroidota bacterium]|nr:agmatine deiminase [Bacteroidota bacterium]
MADLIFNNPTPRQLGFTFPAEFEPQNAMWLSWPHKEASWPGKIETIFPVYSQFIKLVAEGQRVCINVANERMKAFAITNLERVEADLSKIDFFFHPTDDAWCRDHGPAFLVNRSTKEKVIVDWDYNAWGDKYPPYDLDDVIPTLIGGKLNLKVFNPGIIMEGGSVDFNGKGTLLTTTSCLLHKNRNPQLSRSEIEHYLVEFYGVENVLWLGDGIDGDDTDGHIDDLTRFVNADTVITMVEENAEDDNYKPLQDNLKLLNTMRLENGKQLNVVELPMPHLVMYEDQRLPASYANFYIANKYVVVPTFHDKKNDQRALDILQSCFKDKKVIGLDSTDLIWGLGSFHCLSQQEPAV